MAHDKVDQSAPIIAIALSVLLALAPQLGAAQTAKPLSPAGPSPLGSAVTAGDSGVALPAPLARELENLRRAGDDALVAEITPQLELIILLRQAAQALRDGRQAQGQRLLREASLSARRQGRPFEMPRTPSELDDQAQLANMDLQNLLHKQQQIVQILSNISALLADTEMGIIRNMK
jgi:hypothetical protein